MGGGTIKAYGAAQPTAVCNRPENRIVNYEIRTACRCGFCRKLNLTMRRKTKDKGGVPMAVMPQVEQPRVETEIKIGNTYYRVNGLFASQGVTVSKKIMRALDKETKK